MKITQFKGSMENINVFKPVCGFLVNKVLKGSKIRVRMIDSENGSTVEVIPSLPIEMLMEFSTYGEGSFLTMKDSTNEYLSGFIKISDDAVALSNSRYLSVDITQPKSDGALTELYGFESTDVPVNFFYRYNSLYVGAGELTKSFQKGDHEVLAIPISLESLSEAQLDEVQLYTKNGTSPVYTIEELRFMALQNNDIVKVHFESDASKISDGSRAQWCIIDLEDVVSFDIKLKANPKGMNIVLVDSKDVKEVKTA